MKNTIFEMKNTLDGINSRLFTAKEKISESADMETIQNEDQRICTFYLGYRDLQHMPFSLFMMRKNEKG